MIQEAIEQGEKDTESMLENSSDDDTMKKKYGSHSKITHSNYGPYYDQPHDTPNLLSWHYNDPPFGEPATCSRAVRARKQKRLLSL